MVATSTSVTELCRTAQHAARELAVLETTVKDAALEAIAQALLDRTEVVLEANARDLERAGGEGSDAAFIDRLRLDTSRIEAMAEGVRAIAALDDPVGEVIEEIQRPNGLRITKVRVPLGVVAVVYEARPNVTIDSAALCLKSGNAIVLRGSSAAANSNAALVVIAAQAASEAGVPEGAISLVAGGGHEELAELATQNGLVEVIIPRGGEGLKAALQSVATVPVIYAASGNCHVYIDADADLKVAAAIAYNAKVQRPGVCNAAETLLVHSDVAAELLPSLLTSLHDAGVEVRGDERVQALAPGGVEVGEASEADWDAEYLAMIMAVRVVDSLEQAIEHIARHGTGHSEAIVTRDLAAARRFQLEVDAACVYVNASTRFTDGFEFGMGAEIGNSTQKLHARGPIGVRELCTIKYLIEGDGHVRA